MPDTDPDDVTAGDADIPDDFCVPRTTKPRPHAGDDRAADERPGITDAGTTSTGDGASDVDALAPDHETSFKRPEQLFKHLETLGYARRRISGSHHIFVQETGTAGKRRRVLPVVVHGGQLRPDVVRSVLRNLGQIESHSSKEEVVDGEAVGKSVNLKAELESFVKGRGKRRNVGDDKGYAKLKPDSPTLATENASDLEASRELRAQATAERVSLLLQARLQRVESLISYGDYELALQEIDGLVQRRPGKKSGSVGRWEGARGEDPVADDECPADPKDLLEKIRALALTQNLSTLVFLRVLCLQELACGAAGFVDGSSGVIKSWDSPERRRLVLEAVADLGALRNTVGGTELNAELAELENNLRDFVLENYMRWLYCALRDGPDTLSGVWHGEVLALLEADNNVNDPEKLQMPWLQDQWQRDFNAAKLKHDDHAKNVHVKHLGELRALFSSEGGPPENASKSRTTRLATAERGEDFNCRTLGDLRRFWEARIANVDVLFQVIPDLSSISQRWNHERDGMFSEGIADLLGQEVLFLFHSGHSDRAVERATLYERVLKATYLDGGASFVDATSGGGVWLDMPASATTSKPHKYLDSLSADPKRAAANVRVNLLFLQFLKRISSVFTQMRSSGCDPIIVRQTLVKESVGDTFPATFAAEFPQLSRKKASREAWIGELFAGLEELSFVLPLVHDVPKGPGVNGLFQAGDRCLAGTQYRFTCMSVVLVLAGLLASLPVPPRHDIVMRRIRILLRIHVFFHDLRELERHMGAFNLCKEIFIVKYVRLDEIGKWYSTLEEQLFKQNKGSICNGQWYGDVALDSLLGSFVEALSWQTRIELSKEHDVLKRIKVWDGTGWEPAGLGSGTIQSFLECPGISEVEIAGVFPFHTKCLFVQAKLPVALASNTWWTLAELCEFIPRMTSSFLVTVPDLRKKYQTLSQMNPYFRSNCGGNFALEPCLALAYAVDHLTCSTPGKHPTETKSSKSKKAKKNARVDLPQRISQKIQQSRRDSAVYRMPAANAGSCGTSSESAESSAVLLDLDQIPVATTAPSLEADLRMLLGLYERVVLIVIKHIPKQYHGHNGALPEEVYVVLAAAQLPRPFPDTPAILEAMAAVQRVADFKRELQKTLSSAFDGHNCCVATRRELLENYQYEQWYLKLVQAAEALHADEDVLAFCCKPILI